MLAGSDGPGGISFDDPKIAKFIGAVALSFILFSGGLETKWNDIKPVFWQGVSLSTIGVIITAATIGFLVFLLTDFTLLEGLLLGSIVSSTDAAAVFSILRSKSIGLKRESQTAARTGKRKQRSDGIFPDDNFHLFTIQSRCNILITGPDVF